MQSERRTVDQSCRHWTRHAAPLQGMGPHIHDLWPLQPRRDWLYRSNAMLKSLEARASKFSKLQGTLTGK